jgi:phytoene dehydrogenase-like protein
VTERVGTVVIGAGQAGLATSYFLTQRGREHVVLERGRVGDTWRSARWDTTDGPLRATNVVVVTGAFQQPLRTPVRDALPADAMQVDTTDSDG